jgi:hypothetical protein
LLTFQDELKEVRSEVLTTVVMKIYVLCLSVARWKTIDVAEEQFVIILGAKEQAKQEIE